MSAQPYHIPALLPQTLQCLGLTGASSDATQPDIQSRKSRVFVDATLGGGGHSRAIASLLQDGDILYAFDRDAEAISNFTISTGSTELTSRIHLIHSNFRYLSEWMDFLGVRQVDGILADLGVSFHHFDTPERGFSFRYDTPLDMRMNKLQALSAYEVVNNYDEERLAEVLYLYGEFRDSRRIARSISRARSNEPITTTGQLVKATGINDKNDMARLFQAIRIEVNDELGALTDLLTAAAEWLAPDGRLVILTYHSLEDRLVKNFMRAGNISGKVEKDFYGNPLNPFKVIEKGLTADEQEVAANPRARSARLRAAVKLNSQD